MSGRHRRVVGKIKEQRVILNRYMLSFCVLWLVFGASVWHYTLQA